MSIPGDAQTGQRRKEIRYREKANMQDEAKHKSKGKTIKHEAERMFFLGHEDYLMLFELVIRFFHQTNTFFVNSRMEARGLDKLHTSMAGNPHDLPKQLEVIAQPEKRWASNT